MKKVILEGKLYLGLNDCLIIEDNQEKSVDIEDTLARSSLLGKKVKITVEEVEI